MNLEDLHEHTDGHRLVRGVDQLPKGHFRLETAFLYPDGSSVDVFVVSEDPLFPTLKLSDLGQTTAWLLDVQVRPRLSKKRQRFVEDALRIYGVKQSGGALERPLTELGGLIEGVVMLGQACVRVADLTYTRRSSLQSSFSEDLEELLADSDLEFEPSPELVGRHGTKVRVDFLVKGAHSSSAILGLASGNASQAHTLANEIFRRWYDLNIPGRSETRVTVFDDRVDVYKAEDLNRLRDLSEVIALSDRRSLMDLIAA
ncbi:MAG: DUF1828 domain-containing protein [Polyangiaceae bacterium]|jgi:hypothetical protein|nr:DUF1828 domain-containing protein [Polyangiaceae bacterium]MBK8936339.1 DUF1828 domain-containing protein [Polyangiaceae bacterium]